VGTWSNWGVFILPGGTIFSFLGRAIKYLVTQTAATATFLFNQTVKTIRRPSRLAALPYFLGPVVRRTYLKIFPNLNSPIVNAHDRTTNARDLASEYFLEGHRFLAAGQPEPAWEALSRSIETSTDPGHYFVAALTLIVGLGRYKEGISVFARGNALRQRRAKMLGLTESQIRFLDRTWAGSFGHIAELDYPIKLGILEGRKRDDTVLYVPPETVVANRFLLEQWRPHLRMVEHEADLRLSLGSLEALCFDFRGPLLADGSTAHYWEAAAETYRRWYAENREPILSFPEDAAHRGRLALERAGVPSNAWFVALHVREAASKALHSSLHDVLNAHITDYLPAIEEITRRGGWVIRMGDPAMTPLTPMPNVLDYCHSDIRSDWMDIYLFANARFFIGTSSGPAYVPPIYGVPCVLTNWWPPAQRPWHPQDIFIPKLYRRLGDNTFLTLSESLIEPFGYCNSIDYLRQHENVVVEDNTPQDIHAAVSEMFDRLEGAAAYDTEDLKLRQRAECVYEAHSGHGMASVSRAFLREHQAFVE
jgi:putative glycosyltransferase (TIGR04372 family)